MSCLDYLKVQYLCAKNVASTIPPPKNNWVSRIGNFKTETKKGSKTRLNEIVGMFAITNFDNSGK